MYTIYSNTGRVLRCKEMGNRCCSREPRDVDRPLLYQKLEGETKEKKDDEKASEEKTLTEAKTNEIEDTAVTELSNVEE